MKKKTKKHEKDFFLHARKVAGDERFLRAIQKSQKKADKIRLKMAREMIGLNQTDLKGLSQSEVSKIEKRQDLKISTLEKYARALGMKVKISLALEDDDKKEILIYG